MFFSYLLYSLGILFGVGFVLSFFFVKQKTAYEVRISDWSSDVCSSDLVMEIAPGVTQQVWTFDGQVPGPTLRGKLGDIFTVTIVNDEIGRASWRDSVCTYV